MCIRDRAYTLFTNTVPAVTVQEVILMALGGIIGGIIGRKINARMNSVLIEKLFVGVMACIILMSIYNFFYYIC